MKVQYKFPTNLSESAIVKIGEKLKEFKDVEIGDWGYEKSFRFRFNNQNIQLSPNFINITWEAHPISIKIAMLLLQPFLRLLEKDKWSENFFRIFKVTPKEWKNFEKVKLENPLQCLEKLVDKFGIPNRHIHEMIFKEMIKNEGLQIAEVKLFLKKYKGPIPQACIKVLKKILKG